MWSKTKDLIRSTSNDSDDYDEKYIKIEFGSDDENKSEENTGIVLYNNCC